MNSDKRTPDRILNGGIESMRNNAAAPEQIEEAASRVLHTLQSEHAKVVPHPAAHAGSHAGTMDAQGIDRIQSCEDYRALIPAYLSASLTPSRKLLFEDHTHECVLCRKALEQARRRPAASADAVRNTRSGSSRSVAKWAAAAAVAAGVVLAFQTTLVRDFIWPIDVHAMVQTVEGGLYRVQGQQVQPISAGQRVERSELVRTGNSSGAMLQLADGSRIEMNARSELSLDRARDGVRINLNRGNIIVTAAKQKTGQHLYTATKELGVSVVGTVFEVNAGVKGSRVTVIEGEVRVQQGQAVQPLRPGQQLSTDPGMGTVPVHEEISWSRDAEKYIELLRIAKDIAAGAAAIEMRHTSDLVPLVPESTVVFASLPNITQTIAQSYALFKQRLGDNQVLSAWWQQNANATVGHLTIDQIVTHLTRAGNYIGPEVIFAFPKDLDTQAPVVLADVTSPVQLAVALQDAGIRIVLSPEQVQALPRSREPVVFVGQGLLIISSADQVLRSLAFRAGTAPNSFASTQLYGRLAQAYTEGVGWLLAADLERIIGNDASDSGLQQLGIADMQQFIVTQKTGATGGSYEATLGFKQNRRGMASWLAPPSPMGALEFISPNALGVVGIVTKDPTSMFQDIFGLIGKDGSAVEELQNYQTQHRVDIVRDLIAPFGNEVLIAVDGPILPTPAFRMVIEVNDAARLQTTIEGLVSDMNREAAARQQPTLQIASETAAGKTFYSVARSNLPTEMHYTYWMGYMIIAPSRALLMESIQNHDTGNTLPRSAAFRSQLPADGRDYASGFVYQNIQALTSALPVDVLKQTPGLSAIPSLICLYGEADRIRMSSKGVLGMNVADMAGIGGLLNVAGLHGIRQGAGNPERK